MKFNKRIAAINPSMTLGISAKAKAMRAEGTHVVNFSAGEPDFDTPTFIKDAAKKALDEGKTKYTPVSGVPALVNEIIKKLKNDNNLSYDSKQIMVSVGAKGALFNIIMTLVDDGDEVLLPAPYWVSYEEMIKAAGGKTVVVESSLEKDFKVNAADIKKAITDKTKVLMLNSPSNPSGALYTKAELKEIADLLEDKDIWIISDEIYEKITYDNEKHVSIASLSDKMKEKTIVINGFSKSHSMTGWRLGYAAGNKDVIACANRIQGHSTSGATSFAQFGAVEGLKDLSFLKEMQAAFAKRRDIVVEGLNQIEGINCPTPKGAFYVFPDIKGVIGKTLAGVKIEGSMDFCNVLLEKGHVAAVPGIAFGMDNNIRISFATSEDEIKEGLKRIKNLVEGTC